MVLHMIYTNKYNDDKMIFTLCVAYQDRKIFLKSNS